MCCAALLQHTAATHCCNTLLQQTWSCLLVARTPSEAALLQHTAALRQHTTATHYCNTIPHHTWFCLLLAKIPSEAALLQHTTATQYCNTLLQHTTATDMILLFVRKSPTWGCDLIKRYRDVVEFYNRVFGRGQAEGLSLAPKQPRATAFSRSPYRPFPSNFPFPPDFSQLSLDSNRIW